MTFGRTKGGKLCNVITLNVIWTNQKNILCFAGYAHMQIAWHNMLSCICLYGFTSSLFPYGTMGTKKIIILNSVVLVSLNKALVYLPLDIGKHGQHSTDTEWTQKGCSFHLSHLLHGDHAAVIDRAPVSHSLRSKWYDTTQLCYSNNWLTIANM